MKSNFIQIHPKDNVAVALEDVKGCDVIINGFSQRMEVLEDISFGHKIALDDIKKGDMVIKYGAPIGHAVTSIKKGMWVHTHNVRTNLEGKL